MHKNPILIAAAVTLAVPLAAVETRFWQQYDAADYEKAALNKLSLRSDGRLALAPVFKEVFDSSTAFLWAVAEDSKGNLYVGGGAPSASTAKLFQVDTQGRGKLLAELNGLEIHAIAIDRSGRVYAATSPDSKVYRVDAAGKAEVFYDPKAKYIWAMAFNSRGELLVATGDEGKIHKVGADGNGGVFFDTEETHARSLALDSSDHLIVGTEPGGLIVRVSPAGEGFVLHQSAKREVTAVAVGADGAVYAASVGNKQPSVLAPPPALPQPAPVQPSPITGPAAAVPPPARPAPQPVPVAPLSPTIAGGSEVIRIDKEGAPKRVWTHASDVVYAIGFDRQGRILLGTGNRGRIYRLDSERLYTNLVRSTATQITGFHTSIRGATYVVSANIGKLYQLGPEFEKEGWLESEVFDAGAFSYWGRARYEGNEEGGGVRMETRGGNLDRPQKNWSPWAAVALNARSGRITTPAARFLQYRVTLTASPKGASPEISLIEAAYLTKNVAPHVDEIETTPANYRFPAASTLLTASQTLTLPSMGQRSRSSSAAASLDSSTSTMNYAKGHIGVRWRASDDNGDTLTYKVEIRGAGEAQWKLLKDNIRERHLSWDSTAFPDGEYRIRVTANDAPGNPPAQALSGSLESEAFLIDNTPPQISGLTAGFEQGSLTARFKARDDRSIIEKAEYSINGSEWHLVAPVSRLSDASELDYVLTVPSPGAGEVTIAVRVTDEFENQAVDKVTVTAR
jgi:hypothetical protein